MEHNHDLLLAACGRQQEEQESSLEDSRYPCNSVFPQHEPYGKGIGAVPGRVVWSYDTDSVRWDGEGFWWRPENFDDSVMQSMVNDSIASVGADFLINEPAVTEHNGALKDNPNVENYLHEAGLVHNAPSGNVYYNGNGEAVKNLGVHEHWNNVAEKMYSRNLGKGEGIELVRVHSFDL